MEGSRLRRALSWLGLVIMAVSFVYWLILPGLKWPTGSVAKAKTDDHPITRVIIDPGHGGEDSGAIRNGVMEKDLTLDVARRIEQLMQAKGLLTTLTRTGDQSVSLAERASMANDERDSIFVSIHFDEGGRAAATGVQTFYAARQVPNTGVVASWLPFLQQVSNAPTNIESQSLATFVQEALVAGTQAFDRGTRTEQFYVVANVKHPAVLVEGGFLSNDSDITKLTTPEYRQQLAVAITNGVMRYRALAGRADASIAMQNQVSE